MFKVHWNCTRSIFKKRRISKHFMFKVHLHDVKAGDIWLRFQNISCLRFMNAYGVRVDSELDFKTFHV